MPDSEMKSILREIVVDLVDLRANLDLLSRSSLAPTTTAEARATKGLLLQQSRESYDKLLKRIEELA